MSSVTSEKKQLEKDIDTAFDQMKKDLLYFHDKDPEYATKMVQWFKEVAVKNKIIHLFKNHEQKPDKETARRRRNRVYYIDYGVNVGSEFNYPHFCVVLAEFKYHALVIPLSSIKESDAGGWKEDEENLYIDIGEVKGFPLENKECYALVSRIREVSKQRLSDYRMPGTKEFVQIKLDGNQMDLIDEAVKKMCTKVG